MVELLKSRLENAFNEATEGVSIYTLLSILIVTIFITFNENHPTQIIQSLLDTEISNLIGEGNLLTKIKIKEIFYSAIFVLTATSLLNGLKSEYFDLLYLTILKQYISKLKQAQHYNTTQTEEKAVSNYRKNSNIQNFTSIIMLSVTIAVFQDKYTTLTYVSIPLTISQIIWSLHTSAKHLISKILPIIIATTPNITQDELDTLFSNT